MDERTKNKAKLVLKGAFKLDKVKKKYKNFYKSYYINKKDKLANRIYKNTRLMTDDILSVLPGASEIIEDHGIFSKIKQKITEEE